MGEEVGRLGVRKALGVDFGSKRVGLAVSTLGLSPRPLGVLLWGKNRGQHNLAKKVIDYADREGVDGIVVGVPRPDERYDTKQTKVCMGFAQELAMTEANIPVFACDESWSTMEADKTIKMLGHSGAASSTERDAMAAAVILDNFFAGRIGEPEPVLSGKESAQQQAWQRRRAVQNQGPPAESEAPPGRMKMGSGEAWDDMTIFRQLKDIDKGL